MNKLLNTKNILSVILIISIFSIILYIVIKKYKSKPIPPGPKPIPPIPPTPEKVECSLDKNKLKKCNTDSDCNCKEDNFSCIEVTKDVDYVIHKKGEEESNNPCIFAPLGKWCLPKLN